MLHSAANKSVQVNRSEHGLSPEGNSNNNFLVMISVSAPRSRKGTEALKMKFTFQPDDHARQQLRTFARLLFCDVLINWWKQRSGSVGVVTRFHQSERIKFQRRRSFHLPPAVHCPASWSTDWGSVPGWRRTSQSAFQTSSCVPWPRRCCPYGSSPRVRWIARTRVRAAKQNITWDRNAAECSQQFTTDKMKSKYTRIHIGMHDTNF